MPKQFALHQYLLFIAALIALLTGILLFITPPNIFPDPCWGFQVMRSMQMGSKFNLLISPDHADIAKNTGSFLSWWSPGQYLVPYIFISGFSFNIGQATAITVIICQMVGLTGFYTFFKKAGFSQMISSLSLLIIICQQAFFSSYIFYNGGETLLFAFLGWFLYGCIALDKPGIKLALFVLFTGWLGFICKSSFMWMYAAGLLFIWVNLSRGQKNIKTWLINGFWLAVPAVLCIAVIYVLYLSKGSNPSSGWYGLKVTWPAILFPLASPILSGFSADDLANGLIFHNDTTLFSNSAALIILGVLTFLSICLICTLFGRLPQTKYKLMLLIFYVISILFFGSAFIRQLDISYEARHFRVIGLLIVPCVLYLLSQSARCYKIAFGAIIVFIAFFSLRFYALSYIALGTETARGPSGIAQQFIDQPSLDYVTMLDNQNKNAVFVFLSPDLGLEIKHNRFITLPALNDDITIDFEESVYKGYAGPLYILMPSNYIGIRANVLLKCFPGYKGFSLKELSDDYVLYFATQAR